MANLENVTIMGEVLSVVHRVWDGNDDIPAGENLTVYLFVGYDKAPQPAVVNVSRSPEEAMIGKTLKNDVKQGDKLLLTGTVKTWNQVSKFHVSNLALAGSSAPSPK